MGGVGEVLGLGLVGNRSHGWDGKALEDQVHCDSFYIS